MKYGYLGTNTQLNSVEKRVDINEQEALITSYDIDVEMIKEKADSFGAKMTLSPLIDSLEPNDELIVCNLRYLANNLKTLQSIISSIEQRKAKLIILDMKETLSGHLTAFSDFKAYITSAKIKAGIKGSKKEQGRNPPEQSAIFSVTYNRKHNPNMSISEIARIADISRSSVYRILKEEENKK
ncbi:MAG: DNA invertase Pin-like site-specific DNA recombinase [Polaribacter sp.]|jgi:DNA invertase Pin-like site-specific DNA recombinase